MAQVDVIGNAEMQAIWLRTHPGSVLPTGTVEESAFAPTTSGFTGKPWHECVRCGHVDKEASMASVGGKWYCYFSGCALEVQK
jgi:hypothetical protein